MEIVISSTTLSPLAILVSAGVAGGIALNVAKKQKAIDFILSTKSDKRVQDGLSAIRDIHVNQHDEIKKYAYKYQKHPTTSAETSDELELKLKEEFDAKAASIRYTLNHFEYMSVGVAEGIYCESILFKGMMTTITTLYERSNPFVQEARNQSGQKTANEEFEKLAQRWCDAKSDKRNSQEKSLFKKLFNNCGLYLE